MFIQVRIQWGAWCSFDIVVIGDAIVVGAVSRCLAHGLLTVRQLEPCPLCEGVLEHLEEDVKSSHHWPLLPTAVGLCQLWRLMVLTMPLPRPSMKKCSRTATFQVPYSVLRFSTLKD